MAATTLSHLAPVPVLDSHPDQERPRTTFDMPIIRSRRGRDITELIRLTSYAEVDGSSMLSMSAGGQESSRALRAMLFRILVDDDGIGYEANVALLSSDRLTGADLPEGDDPADAAAPVPEIAADAVLRGMGKANLLSLAIEHRLVGEDDDGALTKADLVAALGRKRDDDRAGHDAPGAEIEPADGALEGTVSDAVWRIVWPHDPDQEADEPFEPAADATFDTPDEAIRFCETEGSSRRRFAALLVDPLRTVTQDALTAALNHIAEAATGRPTQRPRASSGSRSTRRR